MISDMVNNQAHQRSKSRLKTLSLTSIISIVASQNSPGVTLSELLSEGQDIIRGY
jgi:hypothetical protein